MWDKETFECFDKLFSGTALSDFLWVLFFTVSEKMQTSE